VNIPVGSVSEGNFLVTRPRRNFAESNPCTASKPRRGVRFTHPLAGIWAGRFEAGAVCDAVELCLHHTRHRRLPLRTAERERDMQGYDSGGRINWRDVRGSTSTVRVSKPDRIGGGFMCKFTLLSRLSCSPQFAPS